MSAEFADLASAIREMRSLAVWNMPNEFPTVVGEFRMVKLAYFLLREYFPEHDRLCRCEGEAMLRHLEAEPSAAELLRLGRGAVAAYLRRFWRNDRMSSAMTRLARNLWKLYAMDIYAIPYASYIID